MGRFVFKLPDIGEGTVEAEIAAWHVGVGDRVEEDQKLVDMMTSKATVEMSSPVSGVVVSITGEPGDMVPVGTELVVLEVAGTGNQPALEPSKTPPATIAARPRPLASPSVRQTALERDIDLRTVAGTGPAGRISRADFDAFIGGPAPSTAIVPVAKRGGVREIKIIGLRRKIAAKMQDSKRSIPHFSYVEEVDVTALEELRQHLNETKRPDQPKLTPLPFLMCAMICLLPDYPEINARYDEDAGVLHRFDAIHIGVATQTPGGLMVPVVRHAETYDLWGCASELGRVTAAARDGKASMVELTGSTITLSSLGALGGIAATPVINHPEVAIIGPNKIVERPVVRHSQIVPRKIMNLSSSFDHRIIDGFVAAEFIQKVKLLLEYPATLFMGR